MSPRQLTNSSYLGDGITVDIIVGPVGGIKIFTLSKSLLTHISSYFDATFNGNFEETKTGKLRLEDISVRAFDHAVTWFYQLSHTNPGSPSWVPTGNETPGDMIETMIEVSELSQRFLVRNLDRTASVNLDDILASPGGISHLTNEHILQAFDNLEENSAVRYTIVSAAFKDFASGSWDIAGFRNDPFAAWKYGDALKNSEGFHAEFTAILKDYFQGRVTL